ncbi:MAG: hypothetical protein ACTS4V_00735 [Candidatus Hodgkinia cicadicola]
MEYSSTLNENFSNRKVMQMKILATAKVVVDPEVQPKVLAGKRLVKGLRRIIDVIDDINVQALIEGLPNLDISVANISSVEDKDILAKLVAMGAKEMIHLSCANELIVRLDCLAKAKLLKDLVINQSFNLVALGIQSSDTSSSQLGAMLAGLLNWPCLTGVKAIKRTPEGTFVAKCAIKNVWIDINVPEPCVLTCDLSVKTPKLITVVDLIKAKRQHVNTIPVLESNFDLKPQVETIEDVVSSAPRCGKVFTNFSDAWDTVTRWLKNRKWL